MPTGLLIAAAISSFGGQGATAPPCPRQPLPPAVESLSPLVGFDSITFSATPSLEHPGRAWVVRLSRPRNFGEATVEILRLRSQDACNRYDIEGRWQAMMPEAEFEGLGRRLTPHILPGSGSPSAGDPFNSLPEIAIDGTSVSLGLTAFGWEVSRRLEVSGRSGAAVSAVFHRIVSIHVAIDARPTEAWRAR